MNEPEECPDTRAMATRDRQLQRWRAERVTLRAAFERDWEKAQRAILMECLRRGLLANGGPT